MKITLHSWANKWNVPIVAIDDLHAALGMDKPDAAHIANGHSEAYVQSLVRLEASKQGMCLWRNNVGALLDTEGRMVRFGLANDSKQLNATVKSADLIGIRPVRITEAHIGHTIGQFISRECKSPTWHYTGTNHEAAQVRWMTIIMSLGGDAAFTRGEL